MRTELRTWKSNRPNCSSGLPSPLGGYSSPEQYMDYLLHIFCICCSMGCTYLQWLTNNIVEIFLWIYKFAYYTPKLRSIFQSNFLREKNCTNKIVLTNNIVEIFLWIYKFAYYTPKLRSIFQSNFLREKNCTWIPKKSLSFVFP